MIKRAIGVVVAGAALLAPTTATAQENAPAPASRPAADAWQRVGDGITAGISGIAVEARHGAAVDAVGVRDNKKPGQNRLVALGLRPDGAPRVRPLAWDGELPVDLEAIDAVPGRAHEFVALASSGTAYRVVHEKDTAKVVGVFRLPGISPDANYEGFALSVVHGKTVAVWADRGQDERPATLSAAEWNPADNSFGKPVSAEFRAPYPTENVRHASDVKLAADGRLTVSSAADPGDDGPFASALYDAGRITVDGAGRIRLAVSRTPHRLAAVTGHKVEALTCLPGSRTGILGTDDENDGGSVAFADFCRP
ncbi:hypothetical protein [Streptomyces sp. NRRL F-4489]|uniref:hypothetical protein n=1 Tax=Streptomyces sp. NRRL F-4489 TaxID=1609095 RepID=UPI000AE5BE66|nr:hypothetical protein [Streptomyces sp. NRRL F-4489]